MTVLSKANAMPAITWHFLKANDATIEIPEGLAMAPDVHVQGVFQEGTADAFEKALKTAQLEWEQTHPEPSAEELAEREAYRAAEADATYGGTARSAYQEGADALEEARSLAAAFEGGMGDEASAFLVESAGKRSVVQVGSGETADVQVLVTAVHGAMSVAAVDVIAERNSVVNVSIVVDGPDDGPVDGPDQEEGQRGLAGTTLRVFAGKDAQVNITRTQTLGEDFTDLDDMGLFADDRSRISVHQSVLGAHEGYAGLAGDLRGDSACIDVDTHYLGMGSQARDFNYLLRHHGTRTRCNLNANGVLAGKSRKALRGTIDLIRGCKGAEGSENETVLLVDEGVQNKTVPVILCNEDDVAGNHGATIGHIREEQMFYLASRGLSREAAEAMFVSAAIERAVIDAPDEAARASVLRLGKRVVPAFADMFE